jgi:hypothetical protein
MDQNGYLLLLVKHVQKRGLNTSAWLRMYVIAQNNHILESLVNAITF